MSKSPGKVGWLFLQIFSFTPPILVVLWFMGLLLFAKDIPAQPSDNKEETDAIVVLTGGSERLESGLALLAGHRAKKLFVSGVHRGTDIAGLFRHAEQKVENFSCCIVLGYSADSTYGNAAETAEWMKRENFHSMLLVTGNYHMRRSLLEFHHVMPEIEIIPWPVFPLQVKRDQWWQWPGTAQLILSEYTKWLAVKLRNIFESGMILE